MGNLGGTRQVGAGGQPGAPSQSVPGVVVVDTQKGTTTCHPLCVLISDPAADPDGDDWSYENSRSCVIPGSLTGHNQPCTTGMPIPPPEPRPGVIVVRATDPECVPVCLYAKTPTTLGSDWAYENNASCLLPSTTTAMGKRECTFGVAPDYRPPALTGTKVAPGFYTKAGRLYDAYGNDFVIRGVNNGHIWFDGYAQFLAWNALDNIQSFGTNTIRVAWKTDGAPSLLADILHRVVELKMVPMVELHDATGVRAAAKLLETAAYYTKPEVVSVLKEFREYLLVNIANEWSGGDDYSATYQTVIKQLRDAGIAHTLVIDASGFGQNAQSIFDNAAALTASDPEKNLLFSVHMYDLFADPAKVDTVLNQAVTSSIPFIVGEFGQQLNGVTVAWERVLATSNQLHLGYIAWSWMGNDMATAQLNMAETWEGPLTAWGQGVMSGPNGITQTSQKSSIFVLP